MSVCAYIIHVYGVHVYC